MPTCLVSFGAHFRLRFSRSPFSAPSLSPYQEPKSSFRYSTYSPAVSSHNSNHHWPIYPSWAQATWSTVGQQQLVSPIATSIANGQWNSNRQPMTSAASSSRDHMNAGQAYQRNTPSAGPCQPSYAKPHASKLPKRSDQIDMSSFIRMAEIKRANGARMKLCTFCRSNDETEAVYRSHSLKDANDKITCPILLHYSCPECGASGENSHTRKYCPVLQKRVRLQMLNRLVTLSNKENGF